MLTKNILKYGFFAALISGSVFLWNRIPLPCEQPISYSLGTFDTRFGISQDDFLKQIALAEKPWEEAADKELFQYAPGAAFKVNLIFDVRQEQTLEAQKLESSLEKTQNTQETIDQKQAKILSLYETASQEYERLLASFKKRLAAYNAEVEKWNKKGGAPEEEYENLQEVAKVLEKDQKVLETKRQEVNRLAAQVNAFSKQQVAVAEEYNGQVEDYISRYGEPEEFDQGEYASKEINIYQYDDLPHLRAVLVHEFGHALGLGHGSDPRSIMYRLMKDQTLDPLALTSEDRTMLRTQCEKTVLDMVSERIGLLRQRMGDSRTGESVK